MTKIYTTQGGGLRTNIISEYPVHNLQKIFTPKEKPMNRRIISLVFVLTLSLALFSPAYANPGQPNFGPGLWADGEVWGTKGAAGLPDASANNMQSFDKLFVITNSNNPT